MLNPEQLEYLKNLQRQMDPFGIFASLAKVQYAWLQDPEGMKGEIQELATGGYDLMFQSFQRMSGLWSEDVIPPVQYDERFQDSAWTDNPFFDTYKEYYLLFSHWLVDAVFKTPEIDDKTRKRAAFWTRHTLDMMSPSNYFWTNPQALRDFFMTGGQSLREGFMLWLKDMEHNDVRMVDGSAFTLGKDVAATKGEVVFRNELLELIQYAPTTKKVHAMPIFIISPWINKYYILDLAPGKSLVEFMVSKGFTVFITSWKNPGREASETGFDDYMFKGVVPAIDAIKEITGQDQIHAAAYCIGGTLLSMLMAWFNHGRGKSPIAHWTLFTTLVDFDSPGDIEVFIDEASVEWLENKMSATGYMDGEDMGTSFRMLRPNSLIWRYVVHSYLYGEEPPPLDVLFWNTDCTRLPAKMHSFYLREMYLNNSIVQPNKLKFKRRPIDLGKIKQPLYVVGTEQDHIAPWKETFKIAGHVSGPVRYTLATSGHILGIINPPNPKSKRRYWVGDATGHQDADEWQGSINKRPGSWWDDWTAWLQDKCGDKVDARKPGSKNYEPIVPAPGEYVLEK